MAVGGKAVTLGNSPSFGFGDRLGLATPGHLSALRAQGSGIAPIFAQQSIREMTRTQRTAQQVMQAAHTALQSAGFDEPWGADADHLKTEADVDVTVAAGFVFFTIDPSEHVDPKADTYSPAELAVQFEKVRSEINWVDQYLNQSVKLKGRFVIKFPETVVQRAAVKYGRAINHSIKLASYIHYATAKLGQDFEIELSVDETPQPTTPAEHYIIADQCLKAGVKLVSLAPRFVGEFEKGIDFKGDLAGFEKSLKVHASIARTLGPYKLSLHSGSDKLSIYPLFAQATKGLFHVKTAGTSYLEALRVIAKHDPPLYRHIVEFARQRYDIDKATYHVSATLDSVPPPQDITDDPRLVELYLQNWASIPVGTHLGFTQPGRQILHCTFGSVLTDPTLGKAFQAVLTAHPQTYEQVLAEHFGRHLEALRAGF